ncbi:hypothetical protein ENSA5_34160 [Enhygromyxa salina]|uniref:Uncharacterized protein n=1 Tax=Enhygromyxa salina TaxID=215803 RepID=A0A2S9XX60_9BACT|nr:hypothetical protein [Enhygromyxa salina]PRP97424.1 hypothetical protein ENSA5_34160 [Enhygromyxa salina]
MRFLSFGSTRTTTLVWAASLLGVFGAAGACTVDIVSVDTGADGTTGDGDGDGDDTSNWEPIPARGDIALSHVVVNQGVDVPIAVAGEWVGPADRNTYVVGNRDTLLRGFWEVPEDWVPRNITAVLQLEYPDGTSESIKNTLPVEGASFPGDFDRAFVFPLVAEQFPPGIEYHLSLWEAGPGYEDQRESTTIIESPIGGAEQIGVQPEPAELKIVMMPVAYTANGCNTNTGDLATVSAEQEQLFIDYIHEQYPVQNIQWEFRRETPIQWTEELTSLAQLWQPLRDQREADAAPPNTYYYALVDACTNGIDGAGGIAPGLATDTKAAAFERVSSGLWLGGDDYSYETMVHELGHNHGRAHVFCSGGDAAGVDPSYPYDDGITGVWGFGIRLFRFHSPTGTYDFMTYCNPTWISDWGWSKAYNRIRTLTSWDYEGAVPNDDPVGEVLVGLLFKDGTEEWSTTTGAREPEFFSSGESVSFDYGDAVIDSPTNVQILDDGTTMITSAVPRPRTTIQAASRLDAGQARSIVLQTPETRAWSL